MTLVPNPPKPQPTSPKVPFSGVGSLIQRLRDLMGRIRFGSQKG